jgi:alginate O-acetyltransferase complex protein AlgI
MLFNSFPFLLVFLPLTLLGLILLKQVLGSRAAMLGLLLASAIFYAWMKPLNLIHLAVSILLNWMLSRKIVVSVGAARKRWLVLGLTLNIGYLCVFKYADFVMQNLRLGAYAPHLGFPLGISFFTVMQIMYLVDCYEQTCPANTLFQHATFVSFFPYVISGPIAISDRIVPQLDNIGSKRGERAPAFARGLYLFAIGLFKKAVLAEAFSRIADYGFDHAARPSVFELFIFSAAYALQLYNDFSGYSDMAIGIAHMIGITVPRNFDAPFQSKSIIEFWQRWHISLSEFITTYLYTPILRSFERPTLNAALLSTIVAMSIAGLWHGAAWTFVIFGLLHGIALALNQYWRRKKLRKPSHLLSRVITLAFVLFAFIFFRADTMRRAFAMLAALLHPRNAFGYSNLIDMHDTISLYIFGLPLLIGCVTAFFGNSSESRAQNFTPRLGNALGTVMLLSVSLLFMNSEIAAKFIYFKF